MVPRLPSPAYRPQQLRACRTRRVGRVLAGVFALGAMCAGAARAAELGIPYGRHDFVFEDEPAFRDRPVTVYTYRPRSHRNEQPVLLVLPGMNRNAEAYRRDWERYARRYRLLLVVPAFREAYFPGSSQYQLGNVYTTTQLTVNDIPDWTAFARVLVQQAEGEGPSPGARIWARLPEPARSLVKACAEGEKLALDAKETVQSALNEILFQKDFYDREAFPAPHLPEPARPLLETEPETLGDGEACWLNRLLLDDAYPKLVRPFRYRRNPRPEWTYTLIEHLFDRVKTLARSVRKTYFLYGHSAGGQFVHRMLLFRPDARVDKAVAANAGRYMLPDFDIAWPYGMKRSGCPVVTVKKAFSRPLTVMVGSEDTDPDDEHLAQSERAMKQGEHRLARAKYFIEAAAKQAKLYHLECAWSLEIVEGAGHVNAQMAPAAARLMFGKGGDD